MTNALRADLAAIPLYAPAPLIGVDLDLRDNVNLWGPPPSALRRSMVDADTLRSYPSVSGGALAQALALALDVAPEQVVVGCGSDDVLDAIFRAVAIPGARVAHADPSFSMVPVFARLNGLEPVAVPLRPDGSAEVDGLLSTGARVIYLCSPNNPTGTVTPISEILRLVDRAPGLVVVDEAYAEFSNAHDLRREAARRTNLLVTRTFSKAWGLAGLRVGYGVASAALAGAAAKARGPYKLNAVAEAVAVEALRNDVSWMRSTVASAISARERIAHALSTRRGVRLFRSEANFVFAATDAPAEQIAAEFQARGIGVRAFRGLTGIGDAIRFGVVPDPELERVLRAIVEIWP